MNNIDSHKKYFGLYCSAVSIAIWLLMMIIVVRVLPVKLDTALIFSWPVLPGAVGGYIFYRAECAGKWDR